MRNKIVASNWKMNLMLQEGAQLAAEIMEAATPNGEAQQYIFCVPHTHIAAVQQVVASKKMLNVKVGAQNCSQHEKGAYTGEISAAMLKDCGVEAVIIGHSERRQYQQESNALLKEKVDAALAQGLQVIFCCGEDLATREAGTQNEYVAKQLQESIYHLSSEQWRNVVIAYEPIWAIGTGKTASTQEAEDMHAFLRQHIAQHISGAVASAVSILYGGSCNASNAAELFAQENIDGGLIGGAALKVETFLPIIEAMR